MPLWLINLGLKAGGILKRAWPYIICALFAAILLYGAYSWAYNRGAHSRDPEVASLHKQITDRDAASAKALADNEVYVSRINGLQDQITKDKDHDAQERTVAGNAAIAAYVLRHPAHSGGSGADHAPGVPEAAGNPDDPLAQAVVSRADLDACNDAWVVAIGLQDWIRAQASIDRNTP